MCNSVTSVISLITEVSCTNIGKIQRGLNEKQNVKMQPMQNTCKFHLHVACGNLQHCICKIKYHILILSSLVVLLVGFMTAAGGGNAVMSYVHKIYFCRNLLRTPFIKRQHSSLTAQSLENGNKKYKYRMKLLLALCLPAKTNEHSSQSLEWFLI